MTAPLIAVSRLEKTYHTRAGSRSTLTTSTMRPGRDELGPLVRQRPCLDAVVKGEVDVAAIDGYALDLLRRHDPAAAARVRVIETTAPAPSPPLVASPGVEADPRERLARALTEAHRAADARPLLDDLLLSRFDRVSPADFAVFLDRERAARDAGYPKLA